jgi:hypothetical protein
VHARQRTRRCHCFFCFWRPSSFKLSSLLQLSTHSSCIDAPPPSPSYERRFSKATLAPKKRARARADSVRQLNSDLFFLFSFLFLRGRAHHARPATWLDQRCGMGRRLRTSFVSRQPAASRPLPPSQICRSIAPGA